MTTILRIPGEPSRLTLPALLLRNAEDHGELPALSWRQDDGWATLTWREVRRKTAVLAAGYAALGVRRGEQVLMMMGNRPEHWLSDLALTHLGAIPVSVYGTAAAEQVAHIVRHSRARFAIVEGTAELPRWEPLLAETSNGLEKLVVVDAATAGPHRTYGSLHASGGRLHQPDAFEKTWRESRADDVLTVVYTSGTTGDPKAVPITHRMVVSNALSLDKAVDLPDHVEHICYLPFAHIAERMLGIYLSVFRASHVHLCADIAQVAPTVGELHPAQFFGVPRVWEKMAAGVRAALAGLPEEQRAAIERMGEATRAYIATRERGELPSPEVDSAHRAAKKGLEPLLALAGFDRLVWTASASAPMPPEVTRFWAGLGIAIMDAWGLTETVGVCTANSPTRGFRLGSVGRPLDGLEVKVAEDGEILVRGETVFRGYLRADGTIEEALDADGWFATGDIGRVDEDGFLWLTDRKKEMIVTSTGKNVSPALVENTLKEHPLIGQALVHGDGKSYVVALLVLDAEVLPAWAARQGVEGPVTADHPVVREEVARAVEAANVRLNRTEQVKRYRVLAGEWGPETGELTPSLKLRRRAIREKYGDEIEALYG
ncbi:AMP-dependent synthetase/ligase [Streptomyces sp. NBC_00237]|uniref:AMP-dependent synthetase/ligase n=1 Tax=Streptomyces sp. NBC_00237 TaxID=2975687 RepID=UPI0022578A72|nr:AMP-dependent synthetase/ligase [Streptomyces sp. NBC_00237]MCX5202903.1 AMP-dependent synthetase/ligase [Streptomyces sp. NBC_00237]